jgi:hypothetical protein
MPTTRRCLPLIVAAVLAMALLSSSRIAQAATFDLTVCDPDPLLNGAALITAITTANNNGQNDVINLGACTYLLNVTNNTAGGNGSNGLPAIVDSQIQGTLTINGNGPTVIERINSSGTPSFRIFYVEANANLTLNNVTIRNGYRMGGSGFVVNGGGAILNNGGTVTITNSTLSGNSSSAGGGGVLNNRGTVNITNSTFANNRSSNQSGGGLYNASGATANITNSTFSGNSALASGGGIYSTSGTVSITNSTLSGNFVDITTGGGVRIFGGTLNLNNTIIANSRIGAANIGNCNYSDAANGDTATINGSFNVLETACSGASGTNNLTNTIIADPALGALASNGGPTQTHALLSNSPALDAGNNTNASSLTTDQRGGGFNRVIAGRVDIGAYEAICGTTPFNVGAGETNALIHAINCANTDGVNSEINLSDSTYTLTTVNNTLLGSNGLPLIANNGTLIINGNNATITRSADGTPEFRLLFTDGASNVTLNNLTLSGGNTPQSGGAIFSNGLLLLNGVEVSNNTAAGDGGAIAVNTGTTTVKNSLIMGNSSSDGGAFVVPSEATLEVSNSTLTGNTADSFGSVLYAAGAVRLTNNTITGNNGGVAAIIFAFGSITMQNSIIAANTPQNCAFNPGLSITGTRNIDSGASCAFSANNFSNTNPLLEPLADNGGTTQTHALQNGSPAIDAGDNALAVDENGNQLTVDQRGQSRFYNDLGMTDTGTGTAPIVDIGAFEKQTNSPIPDITIADVTLAEGNAGTTNFVFTVTLSFASTQTVTVDYAAADGTALVSSDYTAISGTLTFNPGVTSQQITVVVNGDTTLEPDETFAINLTNPSNATLLDTQGTGTISNDDAVPTISINNVTLNEGNGGTTAFTFNVTLSNPSSQTITVDYTTADGSATTVDSDYTAASSTLTFAAGVTAQTITVNVNGDAKSEPDETFTVNLSNPTNATITTAQGTGTISNDDAVPTISIDNVTLNEGNGGTTAFTFNVTLSNPSSQTITVDYTTADGSATTVDSDYTAASNTLTFAAGVTAQTITVNVNGDTTFEPDETLTVNLSNPTNATITDAQGTGTITNDDAPPGLSINDISTVEGNSGTTDYVFTVSLASASGLSVSVTVQTVDGTATAGSDYGAVAATLLTFAPGETSKQFTVTVNGDNSDELTETFNVVLSSPVNATIGDNTGIGTITNDDTANVLVSPTENLTTTEAGGTAAFRIVLTSQPTSSVTFNIATSDNTEGIVSPASVVFDDTNWSVEQVITITGLDDTFADGAVGYTIDIPPATTSDALYAAIDPNNVSVTNQDDDSPNIVVQPTTATMQEGDTRTFSLKLNTTPSSGSVVVRITFNSNEVWVNGGSTSVDLTFTSLDPQTFTVTLPEDVSLNDGQTIVLNFTIVSTDAPEYNGVQPITLRLTSQDNDVAFPTPPPVPLCALIEGGTNSIVRANVPSGLNANVFCRILVQSGTYFRTPAEVGDQTLIDAGVLQSVDVFGFTANGVQVVQFNQPVQVCLQGSGHMFYRDASNAPRITVPLTSSSSNGYTCASIPNAGTVVLVR